MKQRFFLLTGVLAVLLIALTGCDNPNGTNPGTDPGADTSAKSITITVIDGKYNGKQAAITLITFDATSYTPIFAASGTAKVANGAVTIPLKVANATTGAPTGKGWNGTGKYMISLTLGSDEFMYSDGDNLGYNVSKKNSSIAFSKFELESEEE